MEMLTRRQLASPAAAAALPASPPKRPRLAAVVTSYYFYSHADVILGRLMAGCSPNNQWRKNRCDVVSLYTHQIHAQDMSRDLAARHGFRIFDSIEKTLTLGGSKLAVDGVVFIGEHGTFPNNELGQKLYPRAELFNQILDVYERDRRAVPTFFDKHFSYSWPLARDMFARARRLKVPLLAGSSVPLSVRVPRLIPPIGTRFERAVMTAYGDADAYGFHTLECLQSIVERRAQTESGVASVQMLRGPAVWEFLNSPSGAWSRPLLDKALATYANPPQQPLEQLVKAPVLFLVDYRDGLRTASFLLNGAIQGWAFAGDTTAGIQSCHFGPIPPPRPLPHFDGLAHCIEELILTGRPPYPADRTLLTTGALAHLFQSSKTGAKIETPELAISYQCPPNPFVQTA